MPLRIEENREIIKEILQLKSRWNDFLLTFAGDINPAKSALAMAKQKKDDYLIKNLKLTLYGMNGLSGNSKVNIQSSINVFEKFLNGSTTIKDDTLEKFKVWLVEQGRSEATAVAVSGRVQRVLREYGISLDAPKQNKVAKDKRIKDETRHFLILEKEVQTYLKSSNPVARAFWIECQTGCRYSDLAEVINTGASLDARNGDQVVSVKTQKAKVYAQIYYSTSMILFCKKIAPWNMTYDKFSRELKKVSKELGLTREVSWLDAKMNEHKEKFCDAITSHCARATRATELLRKGVNKDTIVKMLGWVDDNMLDKVYGKLSLEDKEKEVLKEMGKLEENTEKKINFYPPHNF